MICDSDLPFTGMYIDNIAVFSPPAQDQGGQNTWDNNCISTAE